MTNRGAATKQKGDDDVFDTHGAHIVRRGPRRKRPLRMTLRALRVAAGQTQAEVSDAAGIAQPDVSRIERKDARDLDELVISTKAGYTMWDGPYGDWGSRKYLLSSLDQSLRRMRLDYVDIFYSHRPDLETPLEETMGAVAHAVRSGKALYAGISNYNPEQTKRAAKLLRDLGTPCLIHQPKFHLFDRWIEHGLTRVLVDEGIGGIAFCPLAQGLLTNRYRGRPADARAAAIAS